MRGERVGTNNTIGVILLLKNRPSPEIIIAQNKIIPEDMIKVENRRKCVSVSQSLRESHDQPYDQ